MFITPNPRTEHNHVQVHNVTERRCVSGSRTGGHEKMDFSTGTAKSCNYSRMGRTILDCSEDTSPSPGTPANPIMICQSCHKSIHDGETWHLRYDARAGMLEPSTTSAQRTSDRVA